jgi:maltose O-acetyltransferase
MFKSYKLFYFLQALLKYLPFRFCILLRRWVYRPFFKQIGKNVEIHDNVLFKFPAEISIGDNTKIAQGCILVGSSGLIIGQNVMIGAGTKIITSSHNFSNLDIPMINQGLSFNPITIENDVWFGFNTVVLGGVTIETGSIIAANAVITKNIESFVIVGGIPGRIIKQRRI